MSCRRPLHRSIAWAVPLALVAAMLPGTAAQADTTVRLSFDAAPAVVGQSVATAYPEIRLNPDPGTNNLSYACTPLVVGDGSPSSPPNAVSPKCPGGEFDVPGGLLGVLASGSTGSVSLRFGGYGYALTTTAFTLEAFDSGNQLVASATATATSGSLTVSAPQPTITSFRIRPSDSGGVGFRFWVDDITWTPAAVALPPDFVLTRQPGGTLGLLEGATSEAQPLTVTPVNGSAGQVTWSVTGLPAGITATVTPVAGGGALRFTAAEGTSGVTGTVTVTASPASAATGPSPHSVTFEVSVSSSLTLAAPPHIDAPACGPIPITAVAFGPTAPGTLTLTQDAPVPGVTARLQTRWRNGDITHTSTVTFLTGANTDAAAFSLVITVDAAQLTAATTTSRLRLTLTGGARTLTQDVQLSVHRPALSLSPTVVRPVRAVPMGPDATAPPFDQLTVSIGAPIRLCPGTTVKVGAAATRPADLVADGSSARLTVPWDATSGAVQVTSPSFGTVAVGPLTVRTFRGTAGFPFVNYRPGFDFGDVWEAFGWDAFFKITVFPGVDIPTPIPAPEAGILLGVANTVFDGACFGISRAARDLLAHPSGLSSFAPPGAPDAWHLTGSSGPTDALRHRIAALHLTQMSPEFLHSYLKAKSATQALTPDQLRGAIYSALSIGDIPYLLLDGSGRHHVVLAYDVRPAGAGAWDIDVYDPNVPFTAAEQARVPTAQLAHANALAKSTVHVAANGDWSLTGGTDQPIASTAMQGIALMTAGQIPSKVSMIKLAKPGDAENALIAIFGGGSGTDRARITAIRSGTRSVVTTPGIAPLDPSARLAAAPLLDSGPAAGGSPPGGSPAAAEAWAVEAAGGPVEVSVSGTGTGTYQQTVLSDGFGGSVTLPSASGRTATISYDPSSGAVGYDPGDAAAAAAGGPVTVQVSRADGHGGVRTASLALAGAAGFGDSLVLGPTGAVTVRHDGPPATARLTLTSTPGTATPAATLTATVPVTAGSTSISIPDWSLTTARLQVTGPAGSMAVTVRRPPAPSLVARSVRVETVRGARRAVGQVRVTGVVPGDRMLAVWTAVRGGRTVAQATLPFTARAGSASPNWPLPASARGARIALVPVLQRTSGLAAATVVGRRASTR